MSFDVHKYIKRKTILLILVMIRGEGLGKLD